MRIVTVSACRRVTLSEETLVHLGIGPGDRIALDLLPNGRVEMRAERTKGSWGDVSGMLKGKGNGAALSIEELEDAIAEAAAAAGSA